MYTSVSFQVKVDIVVRSLDRADVICMLNLLSMGDNGTVSRFYGRCIERSIEIYLNGQTIRRHIFSFIYLNKDGG